MPGIIVVTFIVSCNQQLLLCHDIDTRHQVFDDMASCQATLSKVVSRHRLQASAMRTIFGRCRYLLVEPGELRQPKVVSDTDGAPGHPHTIPHMW